MRARKAGGNWEILGANRFGYAYKQQKQQNLIWIHAVSLGETRAAQPLIRALLADGHNLLLSHLTATGWAEAQREYATEIQAGRLQQVWLPYDFPGASKRFLRHFKPAVAILIEREVWPNLVHNLHQKNIAIVLASARMSAKSLRRTLRISALMQPCYSAINHVFAQTLQDARRLELAGAKHISVSGNFKFDIQLDQDKIGRGQTFSSALKRKIIAIASTREGEDEPFIQAIGHQLERLANLGVDQHQLPIFMLIPRHPQRFQLAGELLEKYKLTFVRRTELIKHGSESTSAVDLCKSTQVILGDTLGEMPWFYAASDIAIVGGSFAPLGGQNFIEASALGCPVIVGPHTNNFAQAVADAVAAGAVTRVSDPAAAVKQALAWLEDCTTRINMGDQARHWVGQHAGAVARVVNGINRILGR